MKKYISGFLIGLIIALFIQNVLGYHILQLEWWVIAISMLLLINIAELKFLDKNK